MKYLGHTEKYMSSFYDFEKQTEEQNNDKPEVGRTRKDLIRCTVSGRGAIVTAILAHCCKPTVKVKAGKLTFNFCFVLPKEDGLDKALEAF
ncbi:unnamed protein product [Caenorhabditis nigoni]